MRANIIQESQKHIIVDHKTTLSQHKTVHLVLAINNDFEDIFKPRKVRNSILVPAKEGKNSANDFHIKTSK